jgi:hypothetical protein
MLALLITPGGGSTVIEYVTVRFDLARHDAAQFQEKMNCL